MTSYSAYGLRIDSEIPLPELPTGATEAAAAIIIRLGHVPRPVALPPQNDDYVRVDADTVEFHTPHGGFRLSGAQKLTVDPSPGTTLDSLRLVILGRALGAMLQWRGLLVLHASAVARDGRVRLFLGDSGAGKSTAAARHVAAGWELVADDLVAIDLDDEQLLVQPGGAHLKLWPDSAAVLDLDVGELERVHADHEKRHVALDHARAARQAMPIESIIVLADGANGRETLDRQSALVELLRHSYAPRIVRALGRGGEHLAQCAAIAARCVVRRVDRKHLELA